MPEFRNPYHFVPLHAESKDSVTKEDFLDLQEGELKPTTEHMTHDRYLATEENDIYSGRLICQLKTVSPMVIGNNQTSTSGKPSVVHPFEVTLEEPAIPATTLKGLFSSIIEAASDSTLRVLTNDWYTIRSGVRDPKKHRPAVGMVVAKEGGRYIRPLTFPAMQCQENGPDCVVKTNPRLNPYFAQREVLTWPIYLDGYRNGDAHSFLAIPGLESYHADPTDPTFTNWNAFWELPHTSFHVQSQGKDYRFTSGNFHIKNRFLVSQESTNPGAFPRRLADKASVQVSKAPGILRILGLGTGRQLPRDKKHELFIPIPDRHYFETGKKGGRDYDLFAETAIKQFEEMAKQRTGLRTCSEPPMPYELQGQRRMGESIPISSGPPANAIELHHGDLVYYRLKEQEKPEIDSVALSSLWREDVGHAHDYFQSMPNLIPFDENQDRRTLVTPAEQLLGFIVEEKKDLEKPVPQTTIAKPVSTKRVRGLTGRLLFSFGKFSRFASGADVQANPYQTATILKILSSPKPPCPTFYFKPTVGRSAVKKTDFSVGTATPQGRKFYLHQPYDQTAFHPAWETHRQEDDLEQKLQVRPIKAGAAFLFHVDFENLTRRELALLCFAIQPTSDFHHKLGLGKPLGLGSVKVKPLGVYYIHRQKRYSKDVLFSTQRYHACQVISDVELRFVQGYETEKLASIHPGGPTFQELVEDYLPPPDVLRALELLGRLSQDRIPIHYPLSEEAMISHNPSEKEMQHFEWFVANEKTNDQQPLPPITASTETLPTLPPLRRPRTT